MATWRDDARAAYSIIHDDMCGPTLEGIQELAVPALDRRGLRAGLGPIAQECERAALWDVVARAQAQGHEIVNHSYTHEPITPRNAAHEVAAAKALFDRRLKRPVEFFIFPYDSFSPETVALVAASGHTGARAGLRDDNDAGENPPVNPAEPANDLAVEFDAWPRAYSKYTLHKGPDLLNAHVWAAVRKGGWAVRELHTVIGERQSPSAHGFGPIRQGVYEAHLDFLAAAARANLVWTATPSEVLRYRHARTACGVGVEPKRLVFDASAADCRRFATPISAIVRTRADLPMLRARQAGVPVPVRKLAAGEFSVTADPTRGDVLLGGCAEEPAAVPAPKLEPPVPAASVCDVERVMSPGGTLRVDDLEPPGRPLPQTEDDELPSWSWYPDHARVKRVPEAGGAALRYSGTGLGLWSGVTLMLLTPDGEPACRDVSRHQGLRFRVRGVVESADELTGKVFVSVITSVTRPRVYGGDLEGDGGHFHKIVEVTPEWRTVSIPWAELSRPTWGKTTDLKAPALDKVQAIDFGVSDKTSRFDVVIDDVDLY